MSARQAPDTDLEVRRASPDDREAILDLLAETFGIGWTLSYLVLGIVYYLVLTPVGLLLRLAGHDPLERAREEGRPSYWVERQPARELGRYFRQS
ncbi:MAG TPA: SxtJ family membrane protein [Thermoanaerobaculia bacterium]|nr:SxtJ family membrane protein [Thermoanaerobaculia bacterium]